MYTIKDLLGFNIGYFSIRQWEYLISGILMNYWGILYHLLWVQIPRQCKYKCHVYYAV